MGVHVLMLCVLLPLIPLTAISTDLRRANLTLVRMKEIMSAYDSFLLSAISWATLLWCLFDSSAVDPAVEYTKGTNELFSVLITLELYFLFFSFSFLFSNCWSGILQLEFAPLCVTRTSKKVRSKVPHSPVATMSSLAWLSTIVPCGWSSLFVGTNKQTNKK